MPDNDLPRLSTLNKHGGGVRLESRASRYYPGRMTMWKCGKLALRQSLLLEHLGQSVDGERNAQDDRDRADGLE